MTTSMEERIREAARDNGIVDLRIAGESKDPRRHAEWSSSREILGATLDRILSTMTDDMYTLQIRGARVVGDMNPPGRVIREGIRFEDCAFTGEVWLIQQTVPALTLTNCYFAGPFIADGITVEHNLLAHGCHFADGVSLASAKIGGSLEFDGSHLSKPGEEALELEGCVIGDGAMLRDGFEVDGGLNLMDTTISGALELHSARIVGPINVTNATVSVLYSDTGIWPDASLLDGFTYARLGSGFDRSPDTRLAWLARLLPEYNAQPYTQLATVYRNAGDDTAARKVLIAKQRARRRRHPGFVRNLVTRPWSAILRVTIGYGYAPWRAFPWVAAVLVAAWLVFATAPASGFTTTEPNPDPFQPFLFALEALVPFGKIGGTQWTAHGAYVWWHTGFSAIGWFFATVIAAGLAGVFKRD